MKRKIILLKKKRKNNIKTIPERLVWFALFEAARLSIYCKSAIVIET